MSKDEIITKIHGIRRLNINFSLTKLVLIIFPIIYHLRVYIYFIASKWKIAQW